MKKLHMSLVIGLVLAPSVWAEAPRVPSAESLVQTDAGRTMIALRFDLSGVDPRVLALGDTYLIEWPVGLVGKSEELVVDAYRAPTGWTTQGFAEGGPTLSDETYLDTWTLRPAHVARTGSGFIRLDISELGHEWKAGTTPNSGVILSVPASGGDPLRTLIGSARLVIY